MLSKGIGYGYRKVALNHFTTNLAKKIERAKPIMEYK